MQGGDEHACMCHTLTCAQAARGLSVHATALPHALWQKKSPHALVRPPAGLPCAGQNVGNFITDRNSSRVLAPPGGMTSIVFGDASSAAEAPSPRSRKADPPLSPAARAGLPAGKPGPPPGALSGIGQEGSNRPNNNYSRPEGAPLPAAFWLCLGTVRAEAVALSTTRLSGLNAANTHCTTHRPFVHAPPCCNTSFHESMQSNNRLPLPFITANPRPERGQLPHRQELQPRAGAPGRQLPDHLRLEAAPRSATQRRQLGALAARVQRSRKRARRGCFAAVQQHPRMCPLESEVAPARAECAAALRKVSPAAYACPVICRPVPALNPRACSLPTRQVFLLRRSCYSIAQAKLAIQRAMRRSLRAFEHLPGCRAAAGSGRTLLRCLLLPSKRVWVRRPCNPSSPLGVANRALRAQQVAEVRCPVRYASRAPPRQSHRANVAAGHAHVRARHHFVCRATALSSTGQQKQHSVHAVHKAAAATVKVGLSLTRTSHRHEGLCIGMCTQGAATTLQRAHQASIRLLP